MPTADTAPAVVEHLAKHETRIVFLSSSAIRDDAEEQTGVVAKVHADIEHSIENSTREWTFLRPDGFATNALWWWEADPTSDVVAGLMEQQRWPRSTRRISLGLAVRAS